MTSRPRFNLLLGVMLVVSITITWSTSAQDIPERPLPVETVAPEFGDCPFVPLRPVRVIVVVGPNGDVSNASVVPSIAPCAALAINRAVGEWRFTPLARDVRESQFQITLHFTQPPQR